MSLLQNAIDEIFDFDLYEELKEREKRETTMYRTELKEFIENDLT